MDNSPKTPNYALWEAIKPVSQRATARHFIPMVAILALVCCIVFSPGSDVLRGFYAALIAVIAVVVWITHNAKTTEEDPVNPPDPGNAA